MRAFVVAAFVSLGGAVARAQAPIRLVIEADRAVDTISRHIFGQFAEHLGRGIYDGLWTRGDDGQWRARDDVVEALRKLRVPNVRWPGGCFADRYRWRDGVGPRDRRPTIVNSVWGNVTEDNSFGTDEYLDLMQRVGAAPFIVGNVGSGSVQEMAEWWEYVNFPGKSPMADLRRANGRDAPWDVRFWGVGNESWGCGGEMTAEYYANEYKRYASFLSAYGSTRPFRVASSGLSDDYHWTEVLMRDAGRMIDAFDLHYYTIAGTWSRKGSATEFGERQWFASLKAALRMDELIARHAAIMDRYDPAKRVALVVGEWGTWYDVEPGTNPAFLYQQNTLRDALVASVTLDIFIRHADRVRMANIAQVVNVLQAMILTHGDTLVLTPTYHVFEMYSVHQDAVQVPVSLEAPAATGTTGSGDLSLPAVSVSASHDADGGGRIHLSLSNLDPNTPRTIVAEIHGRSVSQVLGRILTGGAINAHNTFDRPDAVIPAAFQQARLSEGKLIIALPPHSVVMLDLR